MDITLKTEAVIAIVVGSVAGGVVLILIIGLLIYCCCCRKSRNKQDNKSTALSDDHRTNGYLNSLPVARLSVTPKSDNTDAEIGKAVGYAYPIVGGRPVSYPYFGSTSNLSRPNASPPSSTGTKSSHPVKRQPSQGLPPNAYRLPGLADKSFSMSDTNLNTAGTINPAYDPTGDRDVPSPRQVYRTQSLMSVDVNDRLSSNFNPPKLVSNVYQYDGSLGRITSRPQEKNGPSGFSSRVDANKRLTSCNEEAVEYRSMKHANVSSLATREDERRFGQPVKIRMASELEAADHIYALPDKTKKTKAPDPPAPGRGLPRIPLSTTTEADEEKSPTDKKIPPTKRSLTSEMSYRAKGHIVTDEAFDFLKGYNEEGPSS